MTHLAVEDALPRPGERFGADAPVLLRVKISDSLLPITREVIIEEKWHAEISQLPQKRDGKFGTTVEARLKMPTPPKHLAIVNVSADCFLLR
jgi:hypothetical protein